MKKSKFTDSQIMEALKRAESGLAVPEICRELGISSATFYKWRLPLEMGGLPSSILVLQQRPLGIPNQSQESKPIVTIRGTAWPIPAETVQMCMPHIHASHRS